LLHWHKNTIRNSGFLFIVEYLARPLGVHFNSIVVNFYFYSF
jgi:hypothetical protein